MNYLDDTTNMIVMLTVVAILSTAIIGMLFAGPSILKSNAVNLTEQSNNANGSGNVITIPRG
jgi:anti-anti-sigma regulatory factor